MLLVAELQCCESNGSFLSQVFNLANYCVNAVFMAARSNHRLADDFGEAEQSQASAPDETKSEDVSTKF